MSPRRRAVATAAALLVIVALVAMLRDGGEPRRRVPLLPTTTRADLSGVSFPGVEGTTTTTVVAPQGQVVFAGFVRTSDGLGVPGATVQAEWHRVEPPQVVEVLTDETGHWEIRDVAGGRWNLRAWRTPDYATADVEQLFAAHDTVREDLELRVQPVPPEVVTWDIEPDPPIIDENITLVAVFAEQTVDFEGRTTRTPMAGVSVAFVGGRAWERVRGDEVEETDGNGRVEWIVRCTRGGSNPITLDAGVVTETLEPPGCIPITATTTTTTEAPPEPPPTDPPTTEAPG